MKAYQWKSEELRKECFAAYSELYNAVESMEFTPDGVVVQLHQTTFIEYYWKLERMGFIEPVPEPVVVLPCPFCGIEPIIDETVDGRHLITCKTNTCPASRLYKVPLEAWNKRAPCDCEY